MADADAKDATPHGGSELALTDVYGRVEGVATRVIAEETLLVPFKGTLASLQQLFALNPVAAFVWQRIDGQATLESLVAAVLAAYEVDREQAWTDLRELVAGLRDAGLVRQVTAEPGAATGA